MFTNKYGKKYRVITQEMMTNTYVIYAGWKGGRHVSVVMSQVM